MATLSYFIVGPTIIAGIAGFLHGPDKTVPTPPEDWRKAVVDLIIPAYNSESTVDLSIASIAKQTIQPRRILVIDDGSNDNTETFANEIGKKLGMTNIEVVRRDENIGKTPSIRKGAYESDADVEFILDSDTVLVSENYIEMLVKELYKGVGIASACGVIYPMKEKDRSQLLTDKKVGKVLQDHFNRHPEVGYFVNNGIFKRFGRFITNLYRDVLYKFLQRFIYKNEMIFCGTTINPVGCAVAYRRKYIKSVFESADDILGNDLTVSEDIYIGFAFTDEGYRNIQLQNVIACTLEPPINRIPYQTYLWSSAFLQSAFYFNSLVTTPFKIFRKWYAKLKYAKKEKQYKKRRVIKEQYRQSFGLEHTRKYGRPIGWFVFTNTLEKLLFPIVLLLFIIFGWWEPLLITFIVESIISSTLVAMSCKGERLQMFFKSLLVSPIRYFLLMFDLIVISKFSIDLWITRNRKWRK